MWPTKKLSEKNTKLVASGTAEAFVKARRASFGEGPEGPVSRQGETRQRVTSRDLQRSSSNLT